MTGNPQSLRSPLRRLDDLPWTDRYEVHFAADDGLQELVSLVDLYLPGIPNGLESARRVLSRHPESIFVAYLDGKLAGGAVCLYLNECGLARLLLGSLDCAAPDVALLTDPSQRPAAIYVTVVCLPHGASAAIGNMMRWLQRPLYRCADIFSRPITAAGERFDRDVGFVDSGLPVPGLLVYRRQVGLLSRDAP